MTDASGFATVRFSTADLPEQDRVAMWREHYGHTVLRVDIEPAGEASFEAAVTSRALPGLHLLSGMMSTACITRTRELIADGNNDLALVVNGAGAIVASARAREVVLRKGDAVLIDSSELTAFHRVAPGGSFSLRAPHSVLSPLVAGVDDAVMHLIPRHTEALSLLMNYARPLLDDRTLATPDLRRLAVAHLHDLIALALGATRDAADVARCGGVQAARLRSAKAYIMENSGSQNLSIAMVAAHLGVSPRYLQKLFESDGLTFSEFLLGQRLLQAHRMLTSPRFDQCKVSAIAYDAGFGDLSYFNRCFRRRYGATPRDIREAAAK